MLHRKHKARGYKLQVFNVNVNISAFFSFLKSCSPSTSFFPLPTLSTERSQVNPAEIRRHFNRYGVVLALQQQGRFLKVSRGRNQSIRGLSNPLPLALDGVLNLIYEGNRCSLIRILSEEEMKPFFARLLMIQICHHLHLEIRQQVYLKKTVEDFIHSESPQIQLQFVKRTPPSMKLQLSIGNREIHKR
ncbi:hypothetical protein ABPG74_011688 [Tetrahymena malaccensis]